MATLRSVSVNTAGGGDYTSLAAAEAGEQGDISATTGSDEYVEFHCTGGEDSQFSIAGWTTEDANYIHVINDDDHGGAWNGSAYRNVHGSNINITDSYVRLTGLQVEQTFHTNRRGIDIDQDGAGWVIVERCIVRCTDGSIDGAIGCIDVATNAGELVYIRNCVLYGARGVADGYGIQTTTIGGSGEVWIDNVTISDCYTGFDGTSNSNGVTVRNTVLYDCDNYWTGDAPGGSATDYNADDDGSAPGANSITLTADPFVDSGADDYHVASGSELIGAGVDLSGDADDPFSDDIDGDTRSSWDIGADESTTGSVQLVIASSTHGHAAEAPGLTQANVLVTADTLHAHAADSPVPSVAVSLSVSEASHAHALDALNLTQTNVLAPADALHAHATETPALVQANTLALADAIHAHAADGPLGLTQANQLLVQAALHANDAAGDLTLTQASQLVVQAALHGHSADGPTLSIATLLSVAKVLHSHSAEALAVTQAHVLALAGSLHPHAADSPGLVQTNALAVAGMLHSHLLSSPSVSSATVLAVAEALHAHSTESPVLAQAHLLALASALHAHQADTPELTQAAVLAVFDAVHAHLVDHATLAGAAPVVSLDVFELAVLTELQLQTLAVLTEQPFTLEMH